MSLTGLTPQSYLLGALMSVASLKVGEFFASQEKSWRGHVVVFGILGVGGVLATPLSRGLSKWTGTILTHTQSLLIFGVTATLKTIGIATARFFLLKEVAGYEEVRNLFDLQLRPLHTHFSAHPDKFQALDLHTQTILNKRFSEQKFEPIAYQAFSDIGTDYSQKELDHLASGIELPQLPSQEDRQKVVLFLYENNFPPIKPKASEDYDLLPITELTEEDVSKLSTEKLQWIWELLLNQRVKEIDSKLLQALTEAFFKAKLPPPIEPIIYHNLEDHLHPSSYNPVPQDEQYLIPWLKNYYHHRADKWLGLPLKTQMDLNRLFGTRKILIPKESDFPLMKHLVPSFYSFYKHQLAFWHVLPASVQLKFNAAFKETSLETFEGLTALPKEDFEEILTMLIHCPYLFDNLSEAQRKEICTRALTMHYIARPQLTRQDSTGNISFQMPNGDLWIKEKNGRLHFKKQGQSNFNEVKKARGNVDAHTKYEWNSETLYYTTPFLHLEPFSKTMHAILDEKSASTMRTACLGILSGFITMSSFSIWCYCQLKSEGIDPFAMPSQSSG